jgi:DNA-binding response OmpR family regulator
MAHTLLLADDSVTIQRVVELTFAEEDIRVISVGNGQQAIDRLSDDPPDIVLADIGMPLLDGYAVASFVRSHDALRNVPVLLMVGAFDSVDEDRVQASGASGVLVKPFEPTLVVSRVKQLLKLGGESASEPQKTTVAAGARAEWDTPTVAQAAPALSSVTQPLAPTSLQAQRAAAPPTDEDLMNDWLGDPVSGRAVDLAEKLFGAPPAPREAAKAASDALWDRYAAPLQAPPPSPAPAKPAAPMQVPATGGVADAFSAFLAVEQGEAPEPLLAALDPQTINAMIEQITTKVLDRVGTAAVQERADRVITEVAERLVREEIQRIRAAAALRRS